MAVIDNAKVSVIGAGSVGASLAYACMIRRSARLIALYDVNAAKVEAEVLDLGDGAQFTGSSQVIGGSDPAVIEGSHVVVVTAGAKQDPGQTRLDLAATNVDLLGRLMPMLLERAPNAVFVLVTNPCDVLTVAAQHITGLPTHRVLSSGTVLDSARLRGVLAARAKVLPSSVHAMIVGEHGDSEFALWSQARIGPVPILDWRRHGMEPFTVDELADITDRVRNAAYKVIAGKGATNYAIGLAGARIVEAILRDENAILPVSTVHQGRGGQPDVAYSMPSLVNATGVEEVMALTLSDEEQRLLDASAETLLRTQASLGI